MARRSLNELRDEMLAVVRGARKPAPLPAAPSLATITEETRELLRALEQSKPANVGQLAALTGRAQSNVSRSLHRLARQGLVRMVRAGREVRPELITRRIIVDAIDGTIVGPAPTEVLG
ncbi:MAG: MarR family transcriptional regulator [Steroidobacteraceae bacterium]